MDLSKLKEPFLPTDLEWRVQQSGEKDGRVWAKVVAYVTNRAIMDRLDEVCGPGKWWNEYRPGPSGGVICGVTINTDERAVTKWDGADNTEIEAVKGGLSNSMKRAAVQWGVGRYLYDLEIGWAEIVEKNGTHRDKTKEGKWFQWNPPRLPAWAMPGHREKAAPETLPLEPPENSEPPRTVPPPRTQPNHLPPNERSRQETQEDPLERAKQRAAANASKSGDEVHSSRSYSDSSCSSLGLTVKARGPS